MMHLLLCLYLFHSKDSFFLFLRAVYSANSNNTFRWFFISNPLCIRRFYFLALVAEKILRNYSSELCLSHSNFWHFFWSKISKKFQKILYFRLMPINAFFVLEPKIDVFRYVLSQKKKKKKNIKGKKKKKKKIFRGQKKFQKIFF